MSAIFYSIILYSLFDSSIFFLINICFIQRQRIVLFILFMLNVSCRYSVMPYILCSHQLFSCNYRWQIFRISCTTKLKVLIDFEVH